MCSVSFLSAIALRWHKTQPKPRLPLETSKPVGYRAVLADRPFLVLVACNVIFALCPFMMSIGLPIYATETLKTSTVIVGALFAFNTLLVICTQTVIVQLLEPYRRTRSLAIACLIRVVGCALFALAPLLPRFLLVLYLFGSIAVYTFGGLIATPTMTALAAVSDPPHLRGRYVAIYEFSWGVAAAITPIVFTLLYAVGPAWPWIAVAGPVLVAGLVVVWLESHLSVEAIHVHQ